MNIRSNIFSCVIESYDKLNNKDIPYMDVYYYCTEYCRDTIKFCALIIHDKDTSKRMHYHLVIEFDRKYAKNTIIADMSKYLMCNSACISVQVANNLVACVQYLTHEFEKDKVDKYDISQIYSNDVERLKSLYDGLDVDNLSIDYLVYLCERCDILTEVYMELGLYKSQKYWRIIEKVFNDVKYEQSRNIKTKTVVDENVETI